MLGISLSEKQEQSVSGLMHEPNTIFPSSDGKAWWELVLSEQFHRPWVEGVRGGVGAVTHSYYLKKSKVCESEKHIKKTGNQAKLERGAGKGSSSQLKQEYADGVSDILRKLTSETKFY